MGGGDIKRRLVWKRHVAFLGSKCFDQRVTLMWWTVPSGIGLELAGGSPELETIIFFYVKDDNAW